ncbi:MAG: hypothetical protein MJA83_01850, partial [Gammaproteobacteria bacterium]|nr:hypothetical protein [Gammaproteobacteria bacterium]
VVEANTAVMALTKVRNLLFVDSYTFALQSWLGTEQIFARDAGSIWFAAGELPVLWYEEAAGIRRDPRFADLAEQLGFVEAWREFGWPDYCEPTDGTDFQCH